MSVPRCLGLSWADSVVRVAQWLGAVGLIRLLHLHILVSGLRRLNPAFSWDCGCAFSRWFELLTKRWLTYERNQLKRGHSRRTSRFKGRRYWTSWADLPTQGRHPPPSSHSFSVGRASRNLVPYFKTAITVSLWASLVPQRVKNLPAMWETWVPSLGQKIPWRRKWYPPQYSCLGNPVDRGAWPATVHGVAKSWTQLSN